MTSRKGATQSKATSTPAFPVIGGGHHRRPQGRRGDPVAGHPAGESEDLDPWGRQQRFQVPSGRRGGFVHRYKTHLRVSMRVDHEQGRQRVDVGEAGVLSGDVVRDGEASARRRDLVLLPVPRHFEREDLPAQESAGGLFLSCLDHFCHPLNPGTKG